MKKGNSGLTLLEILAFIATCAILALLLLPVISRAKKKSWLDKHTYVVSIRGGSIDDVANAVFERFRGGVSNGLPSKTDGFKAIGRDIVGDVRNKVRVITMSLVIADDRQWITSPETNIHVFYRDATLRELLSLEYAHSARLPRGVPIVALGSFAYAAGSVSTPTNAIRLYPYIFLFDGDRDSGLRLTNGISKNTLYAIVKNQ